MPDFSSSGLLSLCFIIQIFIVPLSRCANVSQGDYLEKFSEFDWKLSKAVAKSINDNVILSPISLKLVLAMLYEGSYGNTNKQLEDVLNLSRETRANTSLLFSEILNSLEEPSSQYDLDIGTKLFLDNKARLIHKYEDTLSRLYNASVQQVDFSNSLLAVKEINKWAESVTKGHIQDLISEADAKASTVLLLLNAIYFKGQWLQPFPSNQSKTSKFHISSTETVDAEFMNSVQTQMYTESEVLDACMLRLPYMGDKFAMYIILPNKVDGMKHLLDTLTPDILSQLKTTLEDLEVIISIPKFEYNFASSFRPILEQVGLTDIFNEKANLTGITKDYLMVSNVIQKAGILVNEKGSTAFVATQVDLVSKFGEHMVEFTANRSFIFFIEDETMNTVVFVGKVVNPGSCGKPVVDKMSPNMLHNMKPMITQPSYQGNSPLQQWSNGDIWTPTNGTVPHSPLEEHASIGPGGVMEQSSNMYPGTWGYTSNDTRPDDGPDNKYLGSNKPVINAHDSGGYFTEDGEFMRQLFNQQRFTHFDTELIQKLCSTEVQKNWVVSPSSIKSVLSMVYEGAAGDSLKELTSLLRIQSNKTIGQLMLQDYQKELHVPSGRYVQWLMGNRLMISNKLPILPEFVQTMTSKYYASVDPANFESPIQTAQDINRWINNITNGFIPKLVASDSIDPKSQLVLLSAVYFKGDWLNPFQKKFTQSQCFYVSQGECRQVSMMNQRSYLRYGFNKPLYAHIVELPYSDSRFSMVIVLPGTSGGLADVIKNLPYTPLIPYIDSLKPVEVQLALPSFSVEYMKDLTGSIISLGAKSMFSDQADLRYMLGQRKGKIGRIIHKAKIIVHEKGSEAGAGTAAVIVPLMNSPLIQLSVNQPFLFYLRDKRSGFIFTGLISDPSVK